MGFRAQDTRLTFADLNDDVLLIIFDYLSKTVRIRENGSYVKPKSAPLKNLSSVNRRLRALLRPMLMKSIALSKSQRSQTNNGWVIARKAIDEITRDASLLETTKSLQLELYGHAWQNDYALAEAFSNLITFLRQLPNLQLLRLTIPHSYMLDFERVFKADAERSPLSLNNLTTLYIEYRMVFLLDYCPNLERLALYTTSNEDTRLYQLPLPRTFPHSSHITHLEVFARWTLSEVAYLASMLPLLRHIAVLGYEIYPPLSRLLTEFGKGFKELRVLALPDVGSLDMGFEYGECAIPSFMGGGKTRLECMESKERAQVRAVEMAFGACAGLEECWLGEAIVARVVERGWARTGDVQTGREIGIGLSDSESKYYSGSGCGCETGEGNVFESYNEEDESAEVFYDARLMVNVRNQGLLALFTESEGEGEEDVGDESDGDAGAFEELTQAASDVRWEWSRSVSTGFSGRKDRLLYVR